MLASPSYRVTLKIISGFVLKGFGKETLILTGLSFSPPAASMKLEIVLSAFQIPVWTLTCAFKEAAAKIRNANRLIVKICFLIEVLLFC